ncbi:hypothetical protein NXS19_003014 [Fusarium pseudograminearum]|nr:hypothetical protein NXS19_003014 [Fusarium pseudograminearum]
MVLMARFCVRKCFRSLHVKAQASRRRRERTMNTGNDWLSKLLPFCHRSRLFTLPVVTTPGFSEAGIKNLTQAFDWLSFRPTGTMLAPNRHAPFNDEEEERHGPREIQTHRPNVQLLLSPSPTLLSQFQI